MYDNYPNSNNVPQSGQSSDMSEGEFRYKQDGESGGNNMDKSYETSGGGDSSGDAGRLSNPNSHVRVDEDDGGEDDYDDEETLKEEANLRLADEIIRKQQVLLGVVGVDVPVLRLIAKVSPKYQMGVGIYIIMLDNNGFIVFHPSIKKVNPNS